MRRHRRLSLRKPQPLSVACTRAGTDDVIKTFFEKLGGIYGNLPSKPMGLRSFTARVTEMGRKKVWSVTSGERGKTHTVVTCVSAAGFSILPMII